MEDAKDQSAFTLIETLVVIAITAVLSTIFIVYSGSSNSNLNLYTSRAEVVSTLERAKSLALDKSAYGSYGAKGSYCAFGVHFDLAGGRNYYLYGIATSSNNCSGVNYAWPGSAIQTSTLTGQAQFVSPTPADIYFVPPYFLGSATGKIVIQDKKSGAKVAIGVDAGGSVSALSSP